MIVCGAGPAGAAAAKHMAREGARVLLLERHRLPRDKACGGALTSAALKLVGDDVADVLEASVVRTRWGYRYGTERADLPTHRLGMVKRRDFDLALVERAVQCGEVIVKDGVTVVNVAEDEAGVTVTAKSGEQWRAAHVIGADGAAGATAAAVGLGRRQDGIALDVDIEVDPAVFSEHAQHADFELSILKDGYGWVFPKDGYLSCGVGSADNSVRLPPALDDYLAKVFPRGAIRAQRRRGHRVPFYKGAARMATARVVLVGDAASVVDPIMGEGILYALWSGEIGADLVAEHLRGERQLDDGAEYARRIDTAFGTDLDRLRRYILPIAERSPELFFRRFFLEKGNYVALSNALAATLEGGGAS